MGFPVVPKAEFDGQKKNIGYSRGRQAGKKELLPARRAA
jgi:hypothetical protein